MNDSSDHAHAALSKTSCGVQARPLLASWQARALYSGPAMNLAAHSNAVAVLAIGIDGPLGVALDAACPARGFTYCRTALIEPNQLHLLDTPASRYGFLYLDALSDDLKRLRARCARRVGAVGFDLIEEKALVALLARMDHSAAGWQVARAPIAALLALQGPSTDARICSVAAALLATPADDMDAAGHALAIGLSSSRFQHLFKEETGLPFRRYRLWAKLQATFMMVMDGKTLTEAAHGSGFSSSAHLSAAFKAMFGLSLTQLLSGKIVFVRA